MTASWRAWLCFLLFLASAAAMVLTEVVGIRVIPLIPKPHFNFFDMKIYRDAAHVVLNGDNLYTARFKVTFGFTYPPFAAILIVPLRLLSVHGDEIAAVAVNLILLVLGCRMALGLNGWRAGRPAGRTAAAAIWLVAAVAVWAEPVISTVGYGQIDLLVTVLVMADLLWAQDTRFGGVLIGVAAGIKLTPLVFLPYLLLSGRLRMGARVVAGFAGSVAISFAVLPRDAWNYWTSDVFNTSRVTGTSALASHQRYPGRGPTDQSLHGAALRLFAGHANITEVWLAACLLIGGVGLWLAVLAARRGDEALGYGLTAIVGLLVSPVSWDHHWVIAVPALLLLAAPAGGGRLRRVGGALLAVAIALGSSGLITLLKNTGARLDVGQMLLGNLFVLIGIGAILAAAVQQLRRWRSPSSA